MKQVFNPFLPLDEYIPDGEPHVFNDRVYHYGSHDKEGGYTFCMNDYVVYSAPVDDLSSWRYEGISYKASQDPYYPKFKYMYAPDVCKGNDDKYYLYYCMAGDYGVGGYTNPISVAVSDNPAGPFEYLDHVHFKDGSLMKKYVCFDPAVMNDDGVIRLYYGTSYAFEEDDDFDTNEESILREMDMFGKSREEILEYRKHDDSCVDAKPGDKDSVNGVCVLTLCDDMVTVKEGPKHLIPYRSKGTDFEAHPFFEGASMRKVNDKYYFIYSSWQNHELCYAISDYPDRGFKFKGTIVSNGDIGINGIDDSNKLNMTGTTHGSIININNSWYVFYHRLTHKSDYSRQACAEKIVIKEDGTINQVEITSCGLNNGPLIGKGHSYPAVIACNITNGHMPHGSNSVYPIAFPNVTNIGEDRFIGEIDNGTLIGFKYFDLSGVTKIKIIARTESEETYAKYKGPSRIDERSEGLLNTYINPLKGKSTGEDRFEIRLNKDTDTVGEIVLNETKEWEEYTLELSKKIDSVHPLYLVYHGNKSVQLKEIEFN